MARVLRIAGSFLAVTAAYCVYSFTVVPWVEPSIDAPDEASVSPHDLEQARKIVDLQREDLRQWFQQGDWELKSPIVLETGKGMLLLKEYVNRPGGKVVITPCTMIFLPDNPELDVVQRKRRAIIMQAPQGAELQFDKALQLQSGKIGRLTGGRLRGPIRIFSNQRLPGPEDDLLIHARDLTLDEATIVSSHPLEFEIGPNRGRGRGLRIELARTEGEGGAAAKKLEFGGIDSFELVQDVWMELHPGERDLFLGPGTPRPSPPASAQPSAQAVAEPGPPVAITCDGPFHFDLVKYAATFQQNVEVVRLDPDSGRDEITCRMLQIDFEALGDAPQANGAQIPPPDDLDEPRDRMRKLPKLKPSKIAAWGQPVMLKSPTNGAMALGEYLEFDLLTQQGSLRDEKGASLQRTTETGESNELHAPRIDFHPAEKGSGRLGSHAALGAGWLKIALPDDPQRPPMTVHWSEKLTVSPDGERQAQEIIAVVGDAQVEFGPDSLVKAHDIYLWLEPAPPAPAGRAPRTKAGRRESHRPVKLLATGLVDLKSPQLNALVSQAQIWFDYPSERQTGNSAQTDPKPKAEELPDPDAEPNAPVNRLRVQGQLLMAELSMDANQPRLTRASIERNVLLEETRPAHLGEPPLVMTGDELQLEQPTPETATATLHGRPARIEARGLTLVGGAKRKKGAIHFDRGANRLWTSGAGRLVLPAPANALGGDEPGSQMLDVSWTGKFDFNGRVARFYEGVAARVDLQGIETERLDVTLDRQLSFGENVRQENASVERVFSPGEFYLEHVKHDGQGRQSVERMHAADLEVRQPAGSVLAHGPGWVRRAFVGAGEETPGPLARRRAKPRDGPLQARPGAEALAYLGIEFEGEMRGNLHRHAADFDGPIQAVYGPIGEWTEELNPLRPEELGDRGFVMTCDRLAVQRRGKDAFGDPAYELEAKGQTFVEGGAFTAQAHRLTYSTAKDLLMLEGDLGDQALLNYRKSSGANESKAKARRIWYWPGTNQVSFEDASSFDLGSLLQGQGAK